MTKQQLVLALALIAPSGVALAQTQPAPAAPTRVWVTPPPGNAARGQALYAAQCTACHAIDTHKTGPSHRGVFGRRVGSAPGYQYSELQPPRGSALHHHHRPKVDATDFYMFRSYEPGRPQRATKPAAATSR
jgi:mono/diheme cytochrome c family protein